MGCTSLESVTIPDSVTWIAGDAFRDCTSLESVTIPDSVRDIRGYAFADCINLKTASIPADCFVYDSAFSGCPNVRITYR